MLWYMKRKVKKKKSNERVSYETHQYDTSVAGVGLGWDFDVAPVPLLHQHIQLVGQQRSLTAFPLHQKNLESKTPVSY